MAKLFALEEQDLDTGATELASAPEEGEIAVVDSEMTEDLGKITDIAAGAEDGTAAGEQLEEVQELVADSVENGEGLDPVAAEAVRIAIEAISARVGYNPKAMYSLYATENFQSSSSRLANTKIALETIGEFLKTLWEKIKAAVKSLVKKVKEFYAKHISNLGRVTKALDSIEKKLGTVKGSPKVARVDAPGGLKSAFPGADSINTSTFEDCLAVHTARNKFFQGLAAEVKTIGSNMTASFVTAAGAGGTSKTVIDSKIALFVSGLNATKMNEWLIGGKYDEVKFEDGKFTTTEKAVTKTTSEKVEMMIADVAALKTLVKDTKVLIADTHKFSAVIDAVDKEFGTQALAVDKKLVEVEKNFANTDKTELNAVKNSLSTYNGFISNSSKQIAKLTALNVKLAFSVVGFVKANLAKYKDA